MKKNNSLFSIKNLALLLIGIILIALPSFVKQNYFISVMVTCMLYAAMGQAWNIIGGYGGQISWCHSAFIALGAYTAITFNHYLDISPILTIPIGIVLSVLFATLIGWATLRYSGTFFAIATIAFAEILRVVLLNLDITKGSVGISMPFKGVRPFHLSFANDVPFYYIAFGLMLLSIVVVYLFTRSKSGYFLRAIKGNEVAARTLGANTGKTKVFAFQISAALSSVVGAVYGCFMVLVEPNGVAGMDLAIRIGAVAIIGGMGTLFGPILGAFLVIPSIELASSLLGSSGGTQLLYGLFLIVVILWRPSGVITLLDKEYWKNLKWVKRLSAEKATEETP